MGICGPELLPRVNYAGRHISASDTMTLQTHEIKDESVLSSCHAYESFMVTATTQGIASMSVSSSNKPGGGNRGQDSKNHYDDDHHRHNNNRIGRTRRIEEKRREEKRIQEKRRGQQ